MFPSSLACGACFPLPNPAGNVSPFLTLQGMFPLPDPAGHVFTYGFEREMTTFGAFVIRQTGMLGEPSARRTDIRQTDIVVKLL